MHMLGHRTHTLSVVYVFGLVMLDMNQCTVLVAKPSMRGNVSAVYELLERIVPGSTVQFDLGFIDSCPETVQACFILSDQPRWSNANSTTGAIISIRATSASELSAGVGTYLREWCNMSMGWVRGGGRNFHAPSSWPAVGAPRIYPRAVPWAFAENVCTASYTLVWHSWPQWEEYLDWAALWGINLLPALTGQEEVQYKVFQSLGLSDAQIRGWFNGPALLTWSRGQNSHGNGVMGPLPRSWMQAQWTLQREKILPRMRALGITGQLPAFQGNVPWSLASVLRDANITQGLGQGNGTGWVDGVDPVFGKIADTWMQTLLADFGTAGHVYQMDGFFANGTSWGVAPPPANDDAVSRPRNTYSIPSSTETMECVWSEPIQNAYLAGYCCNGNKTVWQNLSQAKLACEEEPECNGLTVEGYGAQMRGGAQLLRHQGDTAYVLENALQCRVLPVDPVWLARGQSAYNGITRSDPQAIWAYQGWAFYVAGWRTPTPVAWSQLRGFINAAPEGRFIIIDMASDGDGMWRQWGGIWNTPFIWTSLHTFGGSMGLKGNLSRANRIPFDALDANVSGIAGAGMTPEGFDQNPVYFEVIQGAPWRKAPLSNVTEWLVRRGHRRYGLVDYSEDVALAWALLGTGSYSQDLSVADNTGVGINPGKDRFFAADLRTPVASLCMTWQAWGRLLDAGTAVDTSLDTYRYDIVNTGREVLARLSTPMSINFTAATKSPTLDANRINETGNVYVALLQDLDRLLNTDAAFMLGPWLQSARAWGLGNDAWGRGNGTNVVVPSDCITTMRGALPCADYYEWNARVQLTTWYPTGENATSIFGRDNDYARKQWGGLVGDFYAVRASNLRVAQNIATLAYTWTTSTASYPVTPTENIMDVSKAMFAKYASHFEPTCRAHVG